MISKKFLLACMTQAAIAMASSAASAGAVFVNPRDGDTGYAGFFSQPTQYVAGEFSLGQAAAVTKASWYGTMNNAVALHTGDIWHFDLGFRTESGSGAPGALFGSRTVAARVTETANDIAGDRVYLFDAFFAAVDLAGSTPYFFSAVNTEQDNSFRWNLGTDTSRTGFFSFHGDAPWTALVAPYVGAPLNFALETATPATLPEPGTYALVLLGLASVAWAPRPRRR